MHLTFYFVSMEVSAGENKVRLQKPCTSKTLLP